MGECLVGLGHAVRVIFLFDGSTLSLGSCHDLGSKAVGHAFVVAGTCILDEPAECQRRPAIRTHFDRHLVCGTTDAATAHLDERGDVGHRLAEHVYTGFLRALFDDIESLVYKAAGNILLTVHHDGIDELGHKHIPVNRVKCRLPAFCFFSTHNLASEKTKLRGVRLAARALRAVLGTALTAILDTGGVEGAAYNVVLHTWKVLHTATANEYNGVLLKVVTLTGDIGNDLYAIGQTNLGHLAEG